MPILKRYGWLPHEEDNLRTLVERGLTDKALARHFGRTAPMVRGRMDKLGIRRPPRGGKRSISIHLPAYERLLAVSMRHGVTMSNVIDAAIDHLEKNYDPTRLDAGVPKRQRAGQGVLA